MKRLLAILFALALVSALAVTAFADGSFRVEDGYVVGSYEADGFIEIHVNGEGAGAGVGSVDIKVPASEAGNDQIEVYVDGALQDAYIDGEAMTEEQKAEVPPPAEDPYVDVTPAPHDDAPAAQSSGLGTGPIVAIVVVVIAAAAAAVVLVKKNGKNDK